MFLDVRRQRLKLGWQQQRRREGYGFKFIGMEDVAVLERRSETGLLVFDLSDQTNDLSKWSLEKDIEVISPQTLYYSITKCILNLGQSPLFISNLIALFLSLNTISPHKLTPSRYATFLTFSYLDLDTLMHNVKFKSPFLSPLSL